MSVSLYDLLDVAEDATPAEIRAAWKAAIADLDPTDRRFRAYNDAAGVLLDEEKRAAYDAELAAGRAEEPADEAEPAPNADTTTSEDEPDADGPDADGPDADGPDADGPDADGPDAVEPVSGVEESKESKEPPPQPVAIRNGPPAWALLAAAAVAVLSIALLVVVSTWPGSWGGTSPADQAEQAEQAESAAIVAEDAAAAAIPVVLGYDYRTLDEDFAEAEDYLTDDFAAKRTALFDQTTESGLTLREQVVEDKVVVVAAVAKTGLTRVSPEGDRATVVVYVNQDSQKGEEAPRSLQMWATLNMVAEGDAWLLDDICTETACD